MSTNKFRVGDVATSPLGETRIAAVFDGLVRTEGGTFWVDDALRLLRRPVLVGDVLRCGESTITFTIEDGLTPGSVEMLLSRGWTHDDGTAIEPHRAPADLRPSQVIGYALCRPSEDGLVRVNIGGGYATREDIAARIPAPSPRRWSGTLSDWRDLIDEWRPVAVSAEDIVRKLAVAFGVMREPRTEAGDRLLLARSLFRTDPDVIAFVERVGDESIRKVVTKWNAVTMRGDVVIDMWEGFDHEKVERAMQIAWDRDEGGWRARAVARAEVMADWLTTSVECSCPQLRNARGDVTARARNAACRIHGGEPR